MAATGRFNVHHLVQHFPVSPYCAFLRPVLAIIIHETAELCGDVNLKALQGRLFFISVRLTGHYQHYTNINRDNIITTPQKLP